MTLTAAKLYVARVLGGQDSTRKLDAAADAIAATAELWTSKHDWHFLLNRQSITVVGGTDRYTLNANYSKPFSMRFTGTLKRPVQYVSQEYIDATTNDQTTQSDPQFYTIIDDDADFSAAAEVRKVQFYPIPQNGDTALLRYYRVFSGTADPVDCPLRHLYTFLDCARIKLLQEHDSQNPRLPGLILDMYGNGRDIMGRFQLAIRNDMNEGGEDEPEGFIGPTTLYEGRLPTGPSDFYPRGDY